MSENSDSESLRLAAIIIGALVAFTIFIIFLANMVFDASGIAQVSPEKAAEKAWQDVQPIGKLTVAGTEEAAVAAPAAPKSGADVYATTCLACHSTGVAGAPKVGDTAAWEARMANGIDPVMQVALNGKGAMPAKGGNPALSDAEVKAAVEHMLSESGIAVSADVAQPEAAATVPAEAASDAAVMPAAAGPDLAKGQQIYQGACFACHGTGVAGAPRLGDKAAWAPRIATGMDAMMQVAINGRGAMPPKGGHMNLSNDDIASVVAYMVSESK